MTGIPWNIQDTTDNTPKQIEWNLTDRFHTNQSVTSLQLNSMQLGQFIEEVFPSNSSEIAGKEGSAYRAEVPLPGSPSFPLAVGAE